MGNYLLLIEYDGQKFSGWQKQPGRRTVQSEIEYAARLLFCSDVTTIAAGRTDQGVHAIGQAVTMRTPKEIPPEKLLLGFNSLLPPDVSVSSVKRVSEHFNARYDALEKTYEYRIWNRPQRSVWTSQHAWHVPLLLDIAAMRKAATQLTGTHDFTAFSATGGSQENKVCVMKSITVKKTGGSIILTFKGDRFLYRMVRNMAGAIVEAGRGRIPPDRIAAILKSKDRNKAARTAPPQGLFLKKVVLQKTVK